MFNKRKKKKEERVSEEEEEVEVNDSEESEVEDEEDDDLLESLDGSAKDDDANQKSIRAKYNRVRSLFRKHLIYVRVTALLSLTGLLLLSLAGGICSGLNAQGAKARQVTAFNTQLQFSKTAATVTVGQTVRSGTTILIPIFSDGSQPIDVSNIESQAKGSKGQGWTGMTTGIKLPSYQQSNGGSFVPISATKYRMYVSSVKGRTSRATQAKYVKFGATGMGAIIVSNVDPSNVVRVLLENKKATTNPGVTAPGLQVDGKPVDTNRDLIMVNAALGQAKVSDNHFTINSSAEDFLKAIYVNDYLSLWQKDQSSAEKYLKSDTVKLNELQANKSSLDAANSQSSASGSGQSAGQVAIDAQQSLVQSDQKNLDALAQEKTALNDYVKTVAGQMTVSSEFKLGK